VPIFEAATDRAGGESGRPVVPSISLPKGGGAIRGVGEKFAATPVTGTGTTTVPIATSPGRSGFGPQLALAYDSSTGNGPFGFGWSLSLPAISRKTDKGLPQYRDVDESDVYIASGAEDLVPVLRPDGSRFFDDTSAPGYVIHRYRPRIEGLFARIERWTREADGDVHWRSISRDNIATVYGKDDESRIGDPNDPAQVFSWLLCESYDDRGNAILYEYAAESDDNVDRGQANERNRSRTANRYVKRIQYGNRVSRLIQPDLSQTSWLFEVVFDYDEEHYEEVDLDPGVPEPDQHRFVRASASPGRRWLVRPDPFSSHRSGFEVRTYRRCRRVLMFHHIPDLPSGEKGYDGLVRSTEFDYADFDYDAAFTIEDELAHQGSTRFASFIRTVTQSGYVRDDEQTIVVRNGIDYATYLKKSMPPLEFEYSRARIKDQVLELDAESLANLPIGIDGTSYQWMDLHGEGIPGVLSEQGGTWFYMRNLSPLADGGNGSESVKARLAPAELVDSKPNLSLAGGRAQLMDLAGDGQPDVVVLNGPTPGLYEHDPLEDWQPFRPFASPLHRDARDPNLRFVDVDGDGQADVLITEDDAFVWHTSLAEEGFGPARRVAQALDEEKGPRLVFADGTQSVYLADMCGDGLTALVRIRNGEVCYWPNLGYGRFGAKVTMDNAPWLDGPEEFDQRRVRLADIDGSGTNDIIYLARDGVRLYFNQSGNRFGEARQLGQFPQIDNVSSVIAIDLLGNGTACLVWSSPLPAHARSPLRYIDLMGGTKPHLLVRSVNNLGAETELGYASSTRFYLADKRAGKPWVTRLPFPVHVVERVVTHDRLSGNRFITRHAYHHGYFDGEEREFRGFGMVEQWDTEEFAAFDGDGQAPDGTNIDESSHVPPILTKTWFHTGAYLGRNHVSDFFAGLLDGDDRSEYYREPGLTDDRARALLLDDTVFPTGLTVDEEREACRALKGSMLRQEVYALDATDEMTHPYTVTEQNFTIRSLQPRGVNRHGVFYTHSRESINYHYERDPSDPRVRHAVTLRVDDFGNVLESAAIGYGRRQPDPTLAPADRAKQRQILVTYTESRVTNAVGTANDHRAPMPCESRSYELTGIAPGGGRSRLTFDEIAYATAVATALDYEGTPTAGLREKRLIEHMRTHYRRNDLSGPLPLGELRSLALPFESYKLAFTPGLAANVYGARTTDAMFENDGGYVHTEGDANWWIPSGRVFYSPDPADSPAAEFAYAPHHFFLPHRYRDPFHTDVVSTESSVTYDRYDLLVQETRDALDNRVTVGERSVDPALPPVRLCQDYRVLQPALVMDPNRNRSAVGFDALGKVVGTAVMGKPAPAPVEGDSVIRLRADLTQTEIDEFLADPRGPAAATLLGDATTRHVYDLTAYRREPDPANPPTVAATIARETHAGEPAPPGGLRIQVSFSFSDGFGREIQKKAQAEPGPVPQRGPDGKIIVDETGRPQMTPGDSARRWVGSGWTVFNNKGKPVRTYEPFFADTHRFEFDVRIGASRVLFYDPVGRVVGRLHPNHTWEKVVFDAWRQETWDVNDCVMIADPKTDDDVGDFFRRLADADYLPTWDALRTGAANAAAFAARYPKPADRTNEKRAAEKTRVHAATPAVDHSDPLSRTFLTVAHNKLKYRNAPPAAPPVEEFHRTRVVLDVEGNQREVVDARGRVVVRYDYDMLGNRIHQASMEAGERWMLNDVAGNPLYAWDSRDDRSRTAYDVLRRPTDSFLQPGANAEMIVGRIVYGESRPNPESTNSRGRVVDLRDQAGVVTSDGHDFKGNLLRSGRRFAQSYRTTLDWSNAAPLQPQTYTSRTTYDALNRPTQLIAPHNDEPGTEINVVQPVYNEANLLEQVHAWLNRNDEPPSALDPATANLHAVTDIDYDAKGQRSRIDRGTQNGEVIRTSYTYDPDTFRLTHLNTRGLQNLHYTYDPAGNVTNIRDDAQQTVYFRNRRVEPSAEYTYDAVYQLIEASGREHLGLTGGAAGAPSPHTYKDATRVDLLHPGDGNAVGRYLERYVYDVAGNLLSLRHQGTDPNHPGWTRAYAYKETSQLDPGSKSNRLTSTTIGAVSETYSTSGDGYDAHGNMLRMPQLQVMRWDFSDRLQMSRRQAVNAGDTDGVQHQGEHTWFVYDSSGQRVRKVTELAGGQLKDERMYLGGFEVYRRSGANPLVRESLHIMDGHQRIALVERRTTGNEPSVPARLIRYQFGNHLGSATLEVDDQARIISYEEYTPFGSTSYQAVRGQGKTPKRYRFTGKERDEESGLYYHGARYYAPWLARWSSSDPIGIRGGLNLYAYCRNTPVKLNDPSGLDPPDGDKPPVQITPLLTDIAPTGVSGNLQFQNLFSADRSVSGNFAVSGGLRSAFGLGVPGLSLNTTGIADVSGLAAVDTNVGAAGLRFRGGLLLGDLGGLNLALSGEGTARIPVPGSIRLSGLPGSLLSTLPQAEGDLRLSGGLAAGTFRLADFRATASLASGRFEGRFDARSIGDFARLRLDAAGRVGAGGDVSLESARLRATVDVPGVNLEARATGKGTSEGSLALTFRADLRLLGLPSLHAEGTGTASAESASLTGRFYGAGPLFTSYITGGFDLSTSRGISARAGVFGLTYSPGVSVTDPAPPTPGLRAIAGEPLTPWEPGGLTLGASFFQYTGGNFNYISGGLMPDLSQRILTNPRFGVTARWAF
jgi:RHS repeat-associated protein